MSKPRRKKGLLSNQKPKRRWGLFARFIKPLGIISALAIPLFLSFRIGQQFQVSTSSFQRQDERPQFIAIQDMNQHEQDVIRSSYRKLSHVDRQSMQNLAVQVQEGLGLRKIDMIQTNPYHIVIGSHPFVPRLIADLDGLRFVSDDGIIFGRTLETQEQNQPTLRGLDPKGMMIRNKNGTFSTSNGNQRIIDDALLALKVAKAHEIYFRTLLYDDFRGLSGELHGSSSYRITLGFRPFESKLIKLEKILSSLHQRGITSALIELDYKGKAFVKESVL